MLTQLRVHGHGAHVIQAGLLLTHLVCSDRCSIAAARVKEYTMIHLAIILAIVALIAGGLGFTGVAGAAATGARLIFGLFLVLLLIAVFMLAVGISLF